MGSSASKVASKTPRKFPTRAPPISTPRTTSSPASGPKTTTTTPRSSEDDREVATEQPDAPFAERLHQMGIVQPRPTFSPSSTATHLPHPAASTGRSQPSSPAHLPPSQQVGLQDIRAAAARFPPAHANPTLTVLAARQRVQAAAEREFDALGTPSSRGRSLLDTVTIGRVLAWREQGLADSAIEERARLRPGTVARLGPKGLVTPLQAPAI